MTLHKLLWNHFAKFPYQEYADIGNWRMLVFRNFDNVIRIIIEISDDLKCVVCKDLSLNYTVKSSLAEHYRTNHKRRTADVFLNTVATKTPDKLKDMLNNEF